MDIKNQESDLININSWNSTFLNSITNKDYQKSFELIDQYLLSENKSELNDINYYLYLLNIITEVPEKYKLKVKKTKLNDIKIPTENEKDLSEENKIRNFSLQKKFTHSLNHVNELLRNHKTPQLLISRTLLYQAVNVESHNRTLLNRLFKKHDYEEMMNMLIQKQDRMHLATYEYYILLLLKEYYKIKTTKEIPTPTPLREESIINAIETNQFEKALELNTKYNELKNIPNERSIIYNLLVEIISLIDKIKEEKEFPIASKLLVLLQSKDVDQITSTIKEYLSSIQKEDYEFFILNLIRISLIEKDFSFQKPLKALHLISTNQYTYHPNNDLEEFYKKLSENQLEEAKAYLDVISKGNHFSEETISTKELYRVLEILKGKELEKKVIVTTPKKEEILNKKPKEITIKDKNYISKLHDKLLEEKGILMLRPMDDDRIQNIMKLLEEYPDISGLIIEERSKKQIVLRYKSNNYESQNIRQLMNLGNESYKKKEFTKSENYYLKLLKILKEPKSYNYYKLGLIYMMKRNQKKAIDYIKVATYLSKIEQNGKEDEYASLLYRLMGEIEDKDEKPVIKEKNAYFDFDDINNNYSIDHFDEIHSLILESNKDVETACKDLGFSEEKINTIKLLYAREFYMQGNLEQGDLFLKSVEKRKDKSKEMNKIIEEIKRNRKFYQNRQNKDKKELSLLLKPSKK